MRKRVFGLLMAFAMCLSLMPRAVWAVGDDASDTLEQATEKQDASVADKTTAEAVLDVKTDGVENSASVIQGRGNIILYGGRKYRIEDGQIYCNDAALNFGEGTPYKIALADNTVYAIIGEKEQWVVLDDSLAGEASLLGNSDNEREIFLFTQTALGVNTAATCGILANIYAESSFNPTAYVIDTNGLPSYGICQWNGGRYTALQNYCSQNGYDYTTLSGQLQYLKYELTGSERSAFNKIISVSNTAQGAYDAGYNWARYFERCASRYYTARAERARDVYWSEYSASQATLLANDAQTLVNYLNNKVGAGYTSGACQMFVWESIRNCFGRSNTKQACCATKAWQNYHVSESRDNIPLGAAVYFGGSKVTDSVCKQEAGHVGLYVGDGYIVHAWGSKIIKTTIDDVLGCGYSYRGWGWQADYSLNGEHVHQLPIRSGSSSICVRELQEMLNALIDAGQLSEPKLDVDGNFGNATNTKLREYQGKVGLTVDGVCGNATWAALERDAQNSPSPNPSKSTFDLNWVIDGAENWLSQPYVTVDIYVNNVLVVDDCADYSGEWPVGASYRIEDIKASPLCKYEGPDLSKGGGITGTIGANTTYVFLKLSMSPYADVGTDFYAYIINKASQLHLTNDGDKNVTARTLSGAANQIWHFERLGNGAYNITSLENRNQCLDVADFGQASGTNVGVANANGGSAQKWFIYGENDTYAFRAECTNCVMDITNSNYISGVNVQMWEVNSTDAQKFQIGNLGSPSKTLDINWMLDGNQVWGEQEYGTVDVYINGVLDADDVTDYCKEFPMGTRYEITDIKARDGHISQGVHSGSLSGMLVHDSVEVWISFATLANLGVNGWLDGQYTGGLGTDAFNYATVDVYINGELKADDVSYYYVGWPVGTTYEIKDIKANPGYAYVGIHNGTLSGTIGADHANVAFDFATLANLGVNGWLDGQYTGGLGTDAFNYATVDVYINGELKADDVSYYYVGWPVGTTYEIKDIKANPGYSYVGIHNGTLSGTIGADHANVAFDFATVHYLDLNSYLDEAYSGNLGDYGTIDVYVNGVLVKDDVTDYYAELPVGTTYEIKDVKPRAGCSYNGIREGTRTGSIGSENVAVVFDFSNIQTSNLPSASKQETFNGHTYKFYSDAVTWYTAKLLCESMGGHLVTITSKEEDQFIKSFSDGKYAHIGATDANSEGHWEWVTGEPFSYENWIAPPDNYPINDEGCENYTHLRDDGLWNDFPGYITYPFICEFDSVEPTQFVIAYDSNGGSGTMSHGLATEGIAYTLPENAFTPPEDKQFKAWGIGDEEYSPGSSYTFTANSTVRAIWENASNSTSQIMIGNQSALKGATLEIPVTIKNNPGIAGATLTVSYDESALTLNDIIKGALFENGSYSANSETGVVQWYHTENVTDDGVLFTLQFAVNRNAQNGSYTIAVGLRDGIPANLSNADSNIVTVQFVSGILKITSGIRGDVTGDGVVAINDVVKLARAVAGSLTLTEAEIAVADVTGDGVIAINDVVKLARHVAGNLASLQSADNASLLDGESAVISIETYSGMPGETVQIPVSITQNPGIAGMQMDILFDSGLTLKNIIRGAVLSAGTFNPDVSNGRVQWYYEQANVTDIGVLFTLEFEVNAEARSGAYAVAVNLKDGITANLSDYDFNSVSVDFTSGKVQITGSTIDTAINTVSRSENTITANVVCADSNASVFCAVYNNSGKMIAVRSAQITSESNYQFQFDGQQFDYAKAFIVDSDFRPLCESKKS